MKDELLNHLNDPRELERMYRDNKTGFKRTFIELYPQLKGNSLADGWNERLNYEAEEINWGTRSELLIVIIASLVAGVIAKLPSLLSIDKEYFYTRNVGFILFPVLAAWFAWKNKLTTRKVAFIAGSILVALIFINLLPNVPLSDTLNLSCIHVVLFLWALLGVAFVGGQPANVGNRLGYLKYNGDLVVMTTLIVIGGGILTGITIGLFSLIGFQIEKFFFENIVIFGLPAAPIFGTYLTQSNPQLVGKVSPVIARIFSPLVLVMLVVYLVAMIYSGKDPYNDREFLLIFNGLLVGVMAIIFFSVAESSRATKSLPGNWILFLLSIVTIIVNGIALSAIVFRISEWGISPNRLAVLGSNVLILVNLFLVTRQLYRLVAKKADISAVGTTIACYLPVYVAWTIIVTFLFPFIFGFK
jgi:hypothetical protein